ncbi:uncharacterized protein DFL_005733 [Arthrobotrys flagrans]|uniref:Uncharacterized protein n=1 Tax=Arthrobotrys flagrans TaxID=97331 RepID=A0A436ZYY4_ARTFL|nr:hypothetical protein DFL_005733 [Arthrobotrys flagrans]
MVESVMPSYGKYRGFVSIAYDTCKIFLLQLMAPPAFSLLVVLASYDFTAVAFFASVYTILISTIVAASGSSETKKAGRVKRKICHGYRLPKSSLHGPSQTIAIPRTEVTI